MSEATFPLPKPWAPSAVWRLRSDEQLARRASQGEERAFEEIFRRYSGSLYRFCLAMTGSPHDAQDTLQSVMVKVLRALPGEERQIKLRPWLYRVARNEAIEVMRKRREGEELDAEQTAGGSVAETAELRERLRTLLDDLELLPERQRAVLLMRELSGLEFADIGAAFETSAGAARQTLYEARLSLRALEDGRERPCEDVHRELSDADGRAIRRLNTRAHLRSCPECRAFADAIAERRRDLMAIAPLPAGAALSLLRGLLDGSGGGGAGGGALAGSLAPAAQTLAVPAAVKSAAAVALVVASVSAADRSGIVDLPGSGGDAGAAKSHEAAAPGATAARPLPTGGGTAEATPAQPSSGGRGSAGAPTPATVPGGSRESSHGRAASTHVTARAPEDPSSEPGRSQTGQAPPGDGHGESASEPHGSPEQPPKATQGGAPAAGEHQPQQPPGTPVPPPHLGNPGTSGPPAEAPPAPPSPPAAPADAGSPQSGPPESAGAPTPSPPAPQSTGSAKPDGGRAEGAGRSPSH